MQGIDRSFEGIGDEIAALRMEMREDMRGLREDFAREMTGLHGEMTGMRGELGGMRSDLARVQDRMIQVGFGLTFVVLAALITAILALV